MPPTRPPSSGGVTWNAGPAPQAPRVYPADSGRSRALRIMVAGVDKDARGSVEASVRQALGSRVGSGPWSVSVVNLAGKWSVTLDGDRLRGVSFVADSDRLADTIREAVEGGRTAAADGPATPDAPAASRASPAEARDPHVCEHCGKAVLVVYERQPDESQQLAPLACPHCWRIGHVRVGVWAAAGRDYRAEKA
jgi:hypothetical protein